jgi:uncharacterized protein YqeY
MKPNIQCWVSQKTFSPTNIFIFARCCFIEPDSLIKIVAFGFIVFSPICLLHEVSSMSEPSRIKVQLQEDMKSAMRAQEKRRLDAIRLILAAVKQIEVDERIIPDDARMLQILDKMLKQRRDSIEQFQKANRQDLVDQESFEVEVIQSYMPEPLSDAEINQFIANAISETGATSSKDMGKVMSILKSKLQGRADMGAVGAKIKERLG